MSTASAASTLSFSPVAEERLQKTLAKYPNARAALLPALRIAQEEFGFLSPDAMAYVAERLHRVRDPFNVNSVAQAAASFVLRDTETLRKVVGANTSGRLWVTEQLGKLGLHVWPSQGNFVMFDTPHPSGVLNDALLRRGVIIRPLGPYGLPTQIRVTIGTPAENTKFIEALTDSLHALKA